MQYVGHCPLMSTSMDITEVPVLRGHGPEAPELMTTYRGSRMRSSSWHGRGPRARRWDRTNGFGFGIPHPTQIYWKIDSNTLLRSMERSYGKYRDIIRALCSKGALQGELCKRMHIVSTYNYIRERFMKLGSQMKSKRLIGK